MYLEHASIADLQELKTDLVNHICTQELDDGEELCLQSQDLIVGWIEVYFDNVIYEMEQSAPPTPPPPTDGKGHFGG